MRVENVQVHGLDMHHPGIRPVARQVVAQIGIRRKEKDQIRRFRILDRDEALPHRKFLKRSQFYFGHRSWAGIADDGNRLGSFDFRRQVGDDIVNVDRPARLVQNPDYLDLQPVIGFGEVLLVELECDILIDSGKHIRGAGVRARGVAGLDGSCLVWSRCLFSCLRARALFDLAAENLLSLRAEARCTEYRTRANKQRHPHFSDV